MWSLYVWFSWKYDKDKDIIGLLDEIYLCLSSSGQLSVGHVILSYMYANPPALSSKRILEFVDVHTYMHMPGVFCVS